MPRPTRRTALVVGAAAVTVAAASLLAHEGFASPAFGLEAAPRAESGACTRLTTAYPDEVAGADRTPTDVKGAAVWGDGAVIVRCGLAAPLPTNDPCAQVDGVDWVWRASQDDDSKLLITYGRAPAVEVRIDTRHAAPDAALVDLSRLVKPIHQGHKCIGRSDVPTPPPAPAAP
ncbi:DUF3515 family protein [Streptomyces decoyicus]|uniref:DUF3515 family protein n=1 Tax=Streptomyces decoyicus TaxID=249567 RepID=UPI00382B6756